MPALHELASSSMPETNRFIGIYLISSTMVVVPILTLVLACLMVSRIKYPHIARVLGRRRNFYQLAELAFGLVVAITFRELALPLIFCYLVFAPPLNELRVKAFPGRHEANQPFPRLPSPEDA
jgi:CDP-diacylglycerol--serine O-phosphatidyltransferase